MAESSTDHSVTHPFPFTSRPNPDGHARSDKQPQLPILQTSSSESPTRTALPVEIWWRIFRLVKSMIHERQTSTTFIYLSHVSQYWRSIILDMPDIWSTVSIRQFRDPSVLDNIMTRSKDLPIDIIIQHESAAPNRLALWHTIIKLSEPILRWRRLHIMTHFKNYHLILSQLDTKPMPKLISLELMQPLVSNGPFSVDFRHFRLETPLLSSLRITAPLSLFEHFNMSNCPLRSLEIINVDIGGGNNLVVSTWLHNCLEAFSTQLHLLSLSGIGTTLESAPLDLSSLTALKMAGSLTAELQPESAYILNLCQLPSLGKLELENVRGRDWEWFIQSLWTPWQTPKFPELYSLSLSSLELVGVDIHFANAFPKLVQLALVNVNNPQPLLDILGDTDSILPDVKDIRIDGMPFIRRTKED